MTVLTSYRPGVSLVVSPNDTVCAGTAVMFTAVPFNGGPAPLYKWYVNGVNTSSGGGATYSYMPNDGDQVYCKMVSNAFCRLSDTAQSNVEVITVITPVIPDVTILAVPGWIISQGENDTLTAVVTHGIAPMTYQWYVNGVAIPGATNQSYVSNNFHMVTSDSVSCVVTNGGYCNEQSHGWLYVEVYPVGVTQVQHHTSDLSVIPNPNKGVFTVKGSLGTNNDEEVTIELTDVLGQVVYREQAEAKGGKLNKQIMLSSTIANGMYMLSIRSDSENKVFHLVIEQ
jgi:hypothetical protein